MDRARAVALLEQLLRNLDTGHRERPLSLVAQVHVFGSFARGAVAPHDVDLAVDLVDDEQFATDAIADLAYGRDPHRHIRQALVGRSRGCQFAFNQLQRMRNRIDVEPKLLWQRGDALQTALSRLHAITVDPTARRAPRDWMLPQFEGLDRWIPRPIREDIYQAVQAGGLHVERLDLDEGDVRDEQTRWLLQEQWRPGGQTHRAAAAAVAYLESRGVPLGKVRVQGQRLGDHEEAAYHVNFRWRAVTSIQVRTRRGEVAEWLEVLRFPTSGPFPALLMRPLDRDALTGINWGA